MLVQYYAYMLVRGQEVHTPAAIATCIRNNMTAATSLLQSI